MLGSGGASKAIEFVLRKNRMDIIIVSRNPNKNEINYIDLNQELINNYQNNLINLFEHLEK